MRRKTGRASSTSWANPAWENRDFCTNLSSASTRDRVALLSGSCLADGQQTPFLPFIDVVRGSFSISIGEDVSEVAHKLAIGLAELQLHSARNIGLVANLLGLAPSDEALAGLDGVLIGLRTRELLQAMLVARCRLSPVVLLFEDLHWIDSVSEDLIAKIVDEAAGLPLLVLTTRRMEYAPPWRSRPEVTALHLQPLSPDDVLRLVEARLKVKALPEALAVKLIDRAGGNALFAEEIVSFLSEQDVLHMVDGAIEYDGAAVAAALPSSLQDLLTARVDRLAPGDRMLLQAAAVIGRRFDPELLSAVAADASDLEPRLAGMQGARPSLFRLQVRRLDIQTRASTRCALPEPPCRPQSGAPCESR